MSSGPLPLTALVAALAIATAARSAPASTSAPAGWAAHDTLTLRPSPADSARRPNPLVEALSLDLALTDETEWLRAPISGDLLTHPDPWRTRHPHGADDLDLVLDYNRVDLLRFGGWYQVQSPSTLYPRFGARLEYATGRKRVIYGVQLEQPLLPTARFAVGFIAQRRTEHSELQQMDDVENSLALLLAHEDWRDYFEREGIGAYLSWRVPNFSTVSLRMRRDRDRSLAASNHVRSWFNVKRPLRDNPAIEDGETHIAIVRLERLAHRTQRVRAGLYHWIEVERAGGPLGGDFSYTRALADVRSVVRVSPASTFSIRAVGGAALRGTLPRQQLFAVGGVDGLRAHAFGSRRGDHMGLVQGEYSIGLWQLHGNGFEGGLHALVFVDTGSAWNNPRGGWDVTSQKFAVDGGVGVATSEDGMRITFARNLQQPGSNVVVSLRLQRPF